MEESVKKAMPIRQLKTTSEVSRNYDWKSSNIRDIMTVHLSNIGAVSQRLIVVDAHMQRALNILYKKNQQ